ncbi:ester cyclase [Spirosoma areae]
MTTEQSKQRIIEYCNALRGTNKPMDLLDQFISDADMELKGHIQVFEAGIPCYDFIPEDIIAEGSKVMVRFRMNGQHTGDLFGCPPTGNAINITGIILYELADNMIVNHWMEADSVGLMQQISTTVTA